MNEAAIRTELLLAHEHGARRNNPSTTALLSAYSGSGSFSKAVAAAMLTLGGRHAPVIEICHNLQNPQDACDAARDGKIVAGWGSSFVKGEPDPTLRPIWALVSRSMQESINMITAVLGATKGVYPNLGCATAAAALTLGIEPRFSETLFLESRMNTWVNLIKENFAD